MRGRGEGKRRGGGWEDCAGWSYGDIPHNNTGDGEEMDR